MLSAIAAGVLVADATAGVRQGARPAPAPRPVSPPVAMGAQLSVRFACPARRNYHGQGGSSPDVPSQRPLATGLTAAQLRSFSYNGLGESKTPKQPSMPVWGAVISDSQLSDLVAYLCAELPQVDYVTPIPVPASQGPAVAGKDFRKEFTDAKVMGIIRAGSVIGKAPT